MFGTHKPREPVTDAPKVTSSLSSYSRLIGEFRVHLDGVDRGREAEAIRGLRAATAGNVRWAKVEVFDRVAAGEPVTVTVLDEESLARLYTSGWSISRASTAETVRVTVWVPAEHLPDLRRCCEEGGGRMIVH
jgi:antitoxin (DNA-binding transcriptional repressor) of toxin-antitoxin stability system